MTAVVSVECLRKAYGTDVAVSDASFEIAEGEIFGILGRNGAGKTTTVECIQGLRRADSGTIRVLGLDPQSQGTKLRQRIGSQLQHSALPGRLRVGESIEVFAAFADHPVDADELLNQWGLADMASASFDSLSGGQKQRLFIALAFINSPEVVFLDELTQGLDPQARAATWELIHQIRELGTTVVLVTHFMDEVEHLCDRVAVFNAGRVTAVDTPKALVEALGLPSVVRFTTDEADLSWLEQLDSVDAIRRDGPLVEVIGTGPVLAMAAAELVAHSIIPGDLRVEPPTMQDAFVALTATSHP